MSGEVEAARVRVLERDVRRFTERADTIDAEFGDRRHSATWRGLLESRQAELATAREELAKAERPRSVAAADVTPGQALWNPYGGSRGLHRGQRAAPHTGRVHRDRRRGRPHWPIPARLRAAHQLAGDGRARARTGGLRWASRISTRSCRPASATTRRRSSRLAIPSPEYRKGYRTTSEQGREPTTIAHGWNVNGVGVVIDSTVPPLVRPAIRAGQLQVVYREANVYSGASDASTDELLRVVVAQVQGMRGRELRKALEQIGLFIEYRTREAEL